MGVKHPVPHKAITHKTNHKEGWRHPVRNPTTNYPKDAHKDFCRRCMDHNFVCPITGYKPTRTCSL